MFISIILFDKISLFLKYYEQNYFFPLSVFLNKIKIWSTEVSDNFGGEKGKFVKNYKQYKLILYFINS